MAYTKEDLKYLGIDEDTPVSSLPIVGLNVFDNIDSIKLEDRTMGLYEYTLELYKEFLEKLKKLNKTNREKFLLELRNNEVFDNHTLEQENYADLYTYSETHNSTAYNYLYRKLFIEKRPLTSAMFNKGYEILMRGTSNENEISAHYRKNNHHAVSYFGDDGKQVIQFLPISYDEIEWAITYLLGYFNKPEVSEEELFVKPFVIHGLIAALQMFEDGNTRYGRTLQHSKIFMISHKMVDDSFDRPALYFSKTYLPYRQGYRELIYKLALNPNNQMWNEWVRFNLNRVQDQLFNNEQKMELIRYKA